MVRSVSSTESSAPMVIASPAAYSSTMMLFGSPPLATQLVTMSRSVIMPWSLLSDPQMGSAPTARSRIFRATSTNVSLGWAHSAFSVMMSRAVGMGSSLVSRQQSGAECLVVTERAGQLVTAHLGTALELATLGLFVELLPGLRALRPGALALRHGGALLPERRPGCLRHVRQRALLLGGIGRLADVLPGCLGLFAGGHEEPVPNWWSMSTPK